jgi:hypothetical protein
MKRFLYFISLVWLFTNPVFAADNAVVLTPGTGVTMRTKDIGSGVQSPFNILGDAAGAAIYGTAGTANSNVLTVQGIASGTSLRVDLAAVAGVATPVGNGVQLTAPRMTLATDSPGIITLGQTTKAASVPMAIASDQVGIAGTANATVFTVQGIASMTKLLVTPDSIALPANQSVNVSQINAVTPLMGNGVTGTGSQRVTIASDNTAFNVNVGAYPGLPTLAAVPETISATGTTGATTATLAAAVGKTTYICGFAIRANATAAATGNATVTGTITGTMNFTQWTAPLASGIGLVEERFWPCVAASATNTTIAVVSAAPGSGGVVSVSAWGFQL